MTFNVEVIHWLDFNTYTGVIFMSRAQIALKISGKTKKIEFYSSVILFVLAEAHISFSVCLAGFSDVLLKAVSLNFTLE